MFKRLILVTLLLCPLQLVGQETKAIPAKDEECGLLQSELAFFKVSVWDKRQKRFVNDLKYTDFEVVEGKERYELDYFLTPAENSVTGEHDNRYAVGFVIRYPSRKVWYHVKIRIKNPLLRDLVVDAPPAYFY